MKSNKTPSLRTRINCFNREVATLVRNTYFEKLPMCDIGLIAERHGFNTDDMDGIYCGHEGRATIDLGENVWMNVSWYRMDSGRFEVVAYASKGVA